MITPALNARPVSPPVMPSQGALSGFAIEHAVVMMIDDEPINIEMTQAFLDEAGFGRFRATSDSTAALDLLRADPPQVVLLDIQMPKVDGFQILAAMRADETLRHVPVLVLTSATDPETKLRALELGATDFLAKPVDASELTLRLRNTIAARAYLDYMRHFDQLTGLLNRQRWVDELGGAIERARSAGSRGAVLQVDIDRFKQVNEALGPALGDELLRQVAASLREAVARWAEQATRLGFSGAADLARFNGDEFAILIKGIASADCAAGLARLIHEHGARHYKVAGHDIHVTLSIGIALFPDDASDADSLIKRAGTAMHHAKQEGRNLCRFYSPEQDARALQHFTLEVELKRAIERDELVLHYQPKFDTGTGRLVGAEALVRWNHPERGMIPPGQFIPVAEASGLVVALGDWVLRAASRQSRNWQRAGLAAVGISVNVSPQQFRDADFITSVISALKEAGDGRGLCLELTETSMMDDPRMSRLVLNALRDMGFRLSIDDFGTGYSSLSYLRRFPLDELKIDKSFIDEVEHSADSAAIAEAIIVMARSLGLKVVAEGVETDGQLAFLRERRCDVVQGFLLGRPIPAAEFATLWLEDGRIPAACANGVQPAFV